MESSRAFGLSIPDISRDPVTLNVNGDDGEALFAISITAVLVDVVDVAKVMLKVTDSVACSTVVDGCVTIKSDGSEPPVITAGDEVRVRAASPVFLIVNIFSDVAVPSGNVPKSNVEPLSIIADWRTSIIGSKS